MAIWPARSNGNLLKYTDTRKKLPQSRAREQDAGSREKEEYPRQRMAMSILQCPEEEREFPPADLWQGYSE